MFRFLFVLSTVLAIGLGFKIPSERLLDTRIVGGENTIIADYPHQISLQVKSGSSTYHSCGGSIIAERVILTAAHCTSGRVASNIKVLAGVTKVKPVDQNLLLTVEKIIVHEKYNSNTIDSDVSLLILKDPLTFGPEINKIDLVKSNPAENELATVTGWGTTAESGSTSDILKKVDVPIVSNVNCNKKYGSGEITDTMLCAGYIAEGGKDACQGDSGGPLVVGKELVGVVSWGYGCARPNYPGVYASVASLRSWIDSNAAPYL